MANIGDDILDLLLDGKEKEVIQYVEALGDDFDPNMEILGSPLWTYTEVPDAYDFLMCLIQNPKFDMAKHSGWMLISLINRVEVLSSRMKDGYESKIEKINGIARYIISDERSDLNFYVNWEGDTPLVRAAECITSNCDAIFEMLATNPRVDVNVRDGLDNSALTICLKKEFLDKAKILGKRDDLTYTVADVSLFKHLNVDMNEIIPNATFANRPEDRLSKLFLDDFQTI
jgi:hypothetical protein